MLTLESQPMFATQTLIRADRIARLGDKWLGRIGVDQTVVEQLSESQAGLLAEGFLSLETMLGRLMKAATIVKETKTVVLYASKEAGDEVYNQLVESGHCMPVRKPPTQWEVGGLIFTSVEELAKLDSQSMMVDCVILLDPTCMVYKARSLSTYSGRGHDRPQFIVNFLTDHVREGVRPPFLIMTKKKAGALPTDAIARAFCLETFWFLDGPTVVFG